MTQNTTNSRDNQVKKQAEFLVITPNAAGIDIGAREMWVCVPPDRCENNIRKFLTFTEDLQAIAAWLRSCSITSVAMESTGVYWIPLFQLLETSGFKVVLANAREVKRAPCRPKTDRLDCQWLQRLHACGLIEASFRPDDRTCRVRALLRHRENLIRNNSVAIRRMQQALEQMNIKLTEVISDIVGVTGLKILDAILAGERNLDRLADLKHVRVKASRETIKKALRGDYRPEHLFVLKQNRASYHFGLEQILACEQEIETYLQAQVPPAAVVPTATNQPQFTFVGMGHTPKRSVHDPDFDARSYLLQIAKVDLLDVPGISGSTALNLLYEIGTDMSRWPTDKHFVSWLNACPNLKKTGGKVKGTQRKSPNRAAKILRMAAASLHHSKSYLGAFFQRIQARQGFPCAAHATSRKLATIVYHMLKQQVPYRELGADYYQQHYKEKLIKKLHKQAEQFGFSLVANATAPA